MRRIAPALTALCLVAGCSPGGPDAATTADLQDFDASLARLQRGIREKLAAHPGAGQDYRGRTFQQDMSEWVLAEDRLKTLLELRKFAASHRNGVQARQRLDFARHILRLEYQRSQDIARYWTEWPAAPQWRRHWNLVFEANQVPAESPDPALLVIESRMSGALDQGQFGIAANEARVMQEELAAAMTRAADRIRSSLRSAPEFRPRRTRCVPGGPADPQRIAAAVDLTENIEAYYPADAKRRGEQGTLILRVRVDEQGCGAQVAVLVKSGFESIDTAALRWFETAKFSPGSRAGRPILSDLVFKIRFHLGDRKRRAGT